jgi:triphosphoribosyl-dephospho-CoA synthase
MSLMQAAVAPSANPSAAREPRAIGAVALASLWAELALYPKPGLVSLRDAGAHADMDASTFMRSLFALSRYFSRIALAGARGAPFARLKLLGIEAEGKMLAVTGGVNTHRGAIFTLGLICAAAARARAREEVPSDSTLRRILVAEWGSALAADSPPTSGSHGELVALRYGASGARGEAQRAFPAVFEVALPSLRAALARGREPRLARLSALFALLAHVDDTNVLHRGGAEGLAFVRRRAQEFRSHGDVDAGNAVARAEAIHREFVARHLSPGGSADLLAATIFVHRLQRT